MQEVASSQLRSRFRLDAELARGGMGTVFSAQDTATGQRLALKRLSPDAPAEARALFEREFSVLSSLRHPRIIEVYEYGLDAEGPFYTMELLEGSDLRELAPLPPLAACGYLRDVASSLALLHARRLLHRDVSARNVRTHADGRAKLLDFGALMSFGASEQIVGTPPAIPPEALSGQALDQRTDLYSLGALAYFLITGHHAYSARNVQALPEAWASQVVPPSFYKPEIPTELEALVLQLLSLDPRSRPNSASEVIDRLNAIAGLVPDHDAQIANAYFRGVQLVERGRELARADRAIARARQGFGRSWVLEARAGVGKTRLLGEVALRAQLGGMIVLRADASEHAGRLESARALLAQLVHLYPQIGRRVLADIEAQLPQLQEIWPGITAVHTPANDVTPASTPSAAVSDEAWDRLTTLIEERLFALAQQQPLMLAVDNLPLCDNHSAALLMALARRARGAALLMVMTARLPRTVHTPALRGLYEAATAITLHGLSAEGTQQLLRSAFGEIPNAARTANRLHQATHGNPAHSLKLLERWVADGLIQYVGGGFYLPLSIPPAALLTHDQVESDRLLACSIAARELACTVAQLEEPVAFETCVAIEGSARDSRSVYAAIEELLRAEVLMQSAQGLRFRDKRLREFADAALAQRARTQLRERIAQHLVETSDGSFEQQAQAGLQLLHAGHRARGAQLIAAAARAAVKDDIAASRIAKHSRALETALEVYRQEGRGQIEQLELLVPLVLASYEISHAFALRYGDATLVALGQVLGITELRMREDPVTIEGLLNTLSHAPVLDVSYARSEATPDVVTLVTWLIRSVAALVAVSAAAIDHEAEARFIEPLRPFQLFGPTNPAALVFDFCVLLISLTEDRFAQAHRGWSEMYERLQTITTLPASVHATFFRGATFALGLLECQLDDDRALARIKALEAFKSPRTDAMAAQLGFLYYGFRGDINVSNDFRERLEAHAVQHGSAWQMEVWASCTASAVYGNTHDMSGNKHNLAQLDRLRRQIPALTQYWERAAATQHLLAGAPAKAVEIYELTLSRSGPRERVGWAAVRGGLAYAYNTLGEHAKARDLCQETLRLSAEDVDYVAMFLMPQLELCRAHSGLGEHEAAHKLVSELFQRHLPNKNPFTLGTIHGTAAELALARGDIIEFEHHLNMMHNYFAPTRNPALLARSEQLRNLHASALAAPSGSDISPLAAAPVVSSLLASNSMLTTVSGNVERKQRALELVASQTEAREAYLFSRGQLDEPVLLGALGNNQPTTHLLESVRQMFEVIPEDSEETAMVMAPALTTTAEPVLEYRLLPLTILLEGKHKLIGAIAVCGGHNFRPVSHALLGELGMQLYRAGDMISARTIG